MRVKTKLLTAAGALAMGLAGCGGASSSATSPTTAAETALETAHDTTDAPELANVLAHLADGPRDEGLEAWRCDPNPTITAVEVCGQSFPAKIHFQWTNCAMGHGPRADPHPCGDGQPPPPLPDGGLPPPPDGMGPPPPLPDGGLPPPPPGFSPDGGGPTSSGTVDITTDVTSDDSCAAQGSFTFAESVTFSVDQSGFRGRSRHLEGMTKSTSSHALAATSFTKATQLDVSGSETELDGSTSSHALSGNVSVAFDASSGEPVRTVNGQLQLTRPDGTTDAVTLTNVVRDPPRTCRTPVSGTIADTASTGESHTLVFGPTCGSATLDGTAVNLEQGGRGGHEGPGGPGGPHP